MNVYIFGHGNSNKLVLRDDGSFLAEGCIASPHFPQIIKHGYVDQPKLIKSFSSHAIYTMKCILFRLEGPTDPKNLPPLHTF